MSKALKIITIKNQKEEQILRQKSSWITPELLESREFQQFLEDLLYTAKHSEDQGNVPAGGIAAIQVGKPYRVFYSLNYDNNEWELFVNPSIEPEGFIKTKGEEGCLSVPDVTGTVSRYYKIKVRYQDKKGIWITKRYHDINATSIQHEYDHLEGILFIDRMEKQLR
jgi:peptide deformylase